MQRSWATRSGYRQRFIETAPPAFMFDLQVPTGTKESTAHRLCTVRRLYESVRCRTTMKPSQPESPNGSFIKRKAFASGAVCSFAPPHSYTFVARAAQFSCCNRASLVRALQDFLARAWRWIK